MSIYFSVSYLQKRKEKYILLIYNQDFENDLLDIRTTFETYKDDPPLPRNAPPVPGKLH